MVTTFNADYTCNQTEMMLTQHLPGSEPFTIRFERQTLPAKSAP